MSMNKLTCKFLPACFTCCVLFSPSLSFAQTKMDTGKQSPVKKVVKEDVFSIVTMYDEINAKLSTLKDDPFDSSKKSNGEKAIYSEYVGREFLIPSPKPGTEVANARRGGKQNIWPLEYSSGNISISFHDSSLTDDILRDSPFIYWTNFTYDGTGGGRRVRDGRYCSSYYRIDGYGISADSPARATFNFPVATNPTKKWVDDWITLTGSMDIDVARKLSGNVLTYITMKSIKYVYSDSIANGGYNMPRDSSACHAGNFNVIRGAIGKIKIVDKSNNALIAEIEFTSHE